MIKHSTQSVLLHNLFELLAQHRPAFRQTRSYWRVVGLVVGELFNFGRHTVTQGLMALGLTEADWSGWYRLFSRRRYVESRVARLFFRETVTHTALSEPYVVGVDGVQIPRSSLKLAGTSWLKAPRTPVFKVGIHRATLRAWGVVDPVKGGLQSRDSAALSARLSAQSESRARRPATRMGSGLSVFALDAAGTG